MHIKTQEIIGERGKKDKIPIEENVCDLWLKYSVLHALRTWLFSCRRLMTQLGHIINARREWGLLALSVLVGMAPWHWYLTNHQEGIAYYLIVGQVLILVLKLCSCSVDCW